jgi:hypothetical protein
MSINQLDGLREAADSVVALIEAAERCKRLHERNHLALPEVLKRILSVNGTGANLVASRFTAPPDYKTTPPEAQPDWICIHLEDATPTSIALAHLRAAKGPVRARDIVAAVQSVLPNVPSGSIANIGSRLHGKLIRRTEDGWTLDKPESAGVISDGFLWGPVTIFSKQEMAAHRRDAILHVLQQAPSGLQTSQVIEELKRCSSWVRATVNKELVQDDMEILSANNKVRRRGASKKWELSPADQKEGA